ncbi:hypothetical protein Glove_320g51 [Diversispora epigaea]|uniref:Protein kinase domain-containing protein n=1 Tax=Diversispora epigaea TaxID=1348612 RepID=A0A397HP98_9GLOM|nr:hypothetical protein Glove_320g51 [Diversispora epigaea]
MSSNKYVECNRDFTDLANRRCKPHLQIDFDKRTSGNIAIDKFIQDAQQNADSNWKVIEWIPYNRLKDIEEVAKGGFGTIHKAKWITHKNKCIDGLIEELDFENQRWSRYDQRKVALKKFDNNFTDLNEDFLNEIAIHLKTMNGFATPRIYGITQDPETNEFIMVLDYMFGGNLRDYLKNNFNNINWKLKLGYLRRLASNFENIHKLDIIHHDFHPGNILSDNFNFKDSSIKISDFGLSKLIGHDVKNPEKRRIFGVLPYIAPEVLSGEEYTKAADVYSFGIIAYEIVTGFAPYYDIPHDINLARQICDGLRPKIPFHIPKLITQIIMRCWDARVTHRPTFKELNFELCKYRWDYRKNNYKNNNEITVQIKQAKEFSKNKEKGGFLNLIRSSKSKLSTNPTPINYKTHPEAIYTSRLLNYLSLPKPKNDENFENELEELTKSISALSIVASRPVG